MCLFHHLAPCGPEDPIEETAVLILLLLLSPLFLPYLLLIFSPLPFPQLLICCDIVLITTTTRSHLKKMTSRFKVHVWIAHFHNNLPLFPFWWECIHQHFMKLINEAVHQELDQAQQALISPEMKEL